MEESSILPTRFKTETRTQHPTGERHESDGSGHQPSSSPMELELAESFLMFIHSALRSNVTFHRRLEAMQLLPTLGAGASFAVKRTPVSKVDEPPQVLKVSRQSYSAGQHTFQKAAFSAFMKELHALSHPSLRKHRNIIALQAIGCSVRSRAPLEICPSLFLELAPHRTLAEFENSGADLDTGLRRRFCLDVSEGLSAIHSCGIVHGDIKAGNILIFEDSKGGYVAKIADFGCAVFLEGYKDVDPRSPVRLPGVSQPWCAPEATEPVPVNQLAYTDVYSLGLLLFRIMVFGNPFDLFDLPPDGELKVADAAELRHMPNFRYLVAGIIEMHTNERWTRDQRLLVTQIFATALDLDPKARDLDLILKLLKLLDDGTVEFGDIVKCVEAKASPSDCHIKQFSELASAVRGMRLSVEPSDVPTEVPTEVAGSPARSLPVIQFDYALLGAMPLGVRCQIQDSLQVIFNHIVRSQEANLPLYTSDIRQSIYWALFNFYLRSIGSYGSDAIAAIEVLYIAGKASGEEAWKAWGLFYLLQKAQPVPIQRERVEDIYYWTARAQATEGFTQRLLSPCFGEEFHRRVNAERHGAESDKLNAFEACSESGGSSLDAKVGLESLPEDFGHCNSLLHIAAIYGFIDIVKYAVDRKIANINGVNEKSETPLVLACQYGRLAVADYLLDNGADASMEFPANGINALYWLSAFPSNAVPRIAARLQKAGASLQHLFRDDEKHIELFAQDEYLFSGRVFRSPILRAIGNGDLPTTKVLFSMGLDLFPENQRRMAVRYCFSQPMRLAALFHHHQILEYLCSELEQLLKNTFTELANSTQEWQCSHVGLFVHILRTDAVAREALDMTHHIERLCIHGKEWEDACAHTLAVLIKYGLLRDTVGTLTMSGEEIQVSILTACISEFRNTAALRYLVQHEEFAPLINKLKIFLADGFYPVDAALDAANLDAFRVLAEAGAELNLQLNPDPSHRLSPSGATYLHVCASLRFEDAEFVRRILKSGVPAGISDNKNVSALTLAIMKGAFVVAKELMAHGASVNSLGEHGYTTLGFILEPTVASQCDDLVESVRFLLRLTDYNSPSFIVRPEGGVTALMLAANFYHPLAPKIDVFRILLERFPLPEQIDARGTKVPYSTALQTAIWNHNLPAVKDLIKGGADLSLVDHYGEDAMNLAISSLHKVTVRETTLSQRDNENDIAWAREIVSIIAEAKTWPSKSLLSQNISKVTEVAAGLVSRMKKMPHWKRRVDGLNDALCAAVETIGGFQVSPSPTGGVDQDVLDSFVELARQVNLTLSPVHFADLAFEIRPTSTSSSWSPFSMEQNAIESRLPILQDLKLKHFLSWRQSALLEYVIEEVRSKRVPPNAKEWEDNFSKFVKSEDRLLLPYDSKFVRYAEPLLSWYDDARNYKQLAIRTRDDRDMVDRFKESLRRRTAEVAEGRGVSPFSDEFRTFHFMNPDGAELSLDQIQGVLAITTKCICMKPGEDIGEHSMPTVRLLDELLRKRKGCFNHLVHRGAQGELRRMEATMRAAFHDYEMAVGERFFEPTICQDIDL